jgi:hypothetical protein
MALVALATAPGPGPDLSTLELAPQITGLVAGEDLLVVAPCYIKTSDGLVYQSNGTASAEAAEFVGFTARATKSGQPVTLFSLGACFRYGAFSGQAGDLLYVAATAGRLDTAATTGGLAPIARILDTTRIQCIRMGTAAGTAPATLL